MIGHRAYIYHVCIYISIDVRYTDRAISRGVTSYSYTREYRIRVGHENVPGPRRRRFLLAQARANLFLSLSVFWCVRIYFRHYIYIYIWHLYSLMVQCVRCSVGIWCALLLCTAHLFIRCSWFIPGVLSLLYTLSFVIHLALHRVSLQNSMDDSEWCVFPLSIPIVLTFDFLFFHYIVLWRTIYLWKVPDAWKLRFEQVVFSKTLFFYRATFFFLFKIPHPDLFWFSTLANIHHATAIIPNNRVTFVFK